MFLTQQGIRDLQLFYRKEKTQALLIIHRSRCLTLPLFGTKTPNSPLSDKAVQFIANSLQRCINSRPLPMIKQISRSRSASICFYKRGYIEEKPTFLVWDRSAFLIYCKSSLEAPGRWAKKNLQLIDEVVLLASTRGYRGEVTRCFGLAL
jgi:hypothetical protein